MKSILALSTALFLTLSANAQTGFDLYNETMKAVIEFQKANQLTSTNGQVWKETINALMEQLASCETPVPAIAVNAPIDHTPIHTTWINKH